ncbi:MAG: hypothetical protein KJO08_03655, partial [Gammaproteobacteria bacterium]|nr:hypothetical protein [Gammaproteobacteria bacterium]
EFPDCYYIVLKDDDIDKNGYEITGKGTLKITGAVNTFTYDGLDEKLLVCRNSNGNVYEYEASFTVTEPAKNVDDFNRRDPNTKYTGIGYFGVPKLIVIKGWQYLPEGYDEPGRCDAKMLLKADPNPDGSSSEEKPRFSVNAEDGAILGFDQNRFMVHMDVTTPARKTVEEQQDDDPNKTYTSDFLLTADGG